MRRRRSIEPAFELRDECPEKSCFRLWSHLFAQRGLGAFNSQACREVFQLHPGRSLSGGDFRLRSTLNHFGLRASEFSETLGFRLGAALCFNAQRGDFLFDPCELGLRFSALLFRRLASPRTFGDSFGDLAGLLAESRRRFSERVDQQAENNRKISPAEDPASRRICRGGLTLLREHRKSR